MSLEVRNKIVEILNSVQSIGNVHNYQRFSDANGTLRNFYLFQNGDHEELRGWFVTRQSQRETREAVTQTWHIHGYLSWNDTGESELLFNDLVDSITEKFREKYDLDNLVDNTETSTQLGIQVETIEPVMFAGVLCHHARLSLSVVGAIDVAMPGNLVAFERFHGEYDLAQPDQQIDAIDDVELEQ